MEERTLHILEFDKIVEMLASHASSEVGRALCLKVRPSTNLRKIREYQKNTTDAGRRLLSRGSAPSFRGVKDISETLARLAVDARLSQAELLKVSSILSVAERIKAYGETETEDSLSEEFSFLEPLTAPNREIRRCLLSEEEMADDASPALFNIRRKMKQTEEKIRESITGLLNASREYLTEAVITQRDGRYCLPVRAEHKAKVPGLVHDTSATGQTLFVEPMLIVKLNNDLQELASEEKKEMEHVLAVLSASLTPYADDIRDDIRILKKLDMIFAKALFSGELEAAEPVFSEDRFIELKNARHPLIDRKKVVPISMRLGRDFNMLVITGPNTGGKTVTLKTIGLLTLMGQAGLHVPADEATLGVFDEVFADIGDEQSIEQSLSTFSAHMVNIVHILEKAGPSSLCLFDELGSGTDPTEGAALAQAILLFLNRMQVRTVATTHYAEIKIFALKTPGVMNACCEFDVETLSPTYRLLIGIPGKSNAFAISKRLGLPGFVIDEAKGLIDSGNESFEDVIGRLNDDRAAAEKARRDAELSLKDAALIRERLKKREDRIEESKEKILKEARAEAAKILKDAKTTADETVRNINRLAAENVDDKKIEAERERLRSSIRETGGGEKLKVKGPSKPVSPKKLEVGDTVRIMSLGGTEGTVTALPDKDGNVAVSMGFMNSKVRVKDLELVRKAAGEKKTDSGTSFAGIAPKAMTISPELNLIGKTTDEAVPELEKYLDDAYLAHLPSVRIVHGRGTGALKDAVHRRLKKLKYVKGYRLGAFGEGADGVTIVTFK